LLANFERIQAFRVFFLDLSEEFVHLLYFLVFNNLLLLLVGNWDFVQVFITRALFVVTVLLLTRRMHLKPVNSVADVFLTEKALQRVLWPVKSLIIEHLSDWHDFSSLFGLHRLQKQLLCSLFVAF
jgi:hypothetical protein